MIDLHITRNWENFSKISVPDDITGKKLKRKLQEVALIPQDENIFKAARLYIKDHSKRGFNEIGNDDRTIKEILEDGETRIFLEYSIEINYSND